jgi:hypothetical protein
MLYALALVAILLAVVVFFIMVYFFLVKPSVILDFIIAGSFGQISSKKAMVLYIFLVFYFLNITVFDVVAGLAFTGFRILLGVREHLIQQLKDTQKEGGFTLYHNGKPV